MLDPYASTIADGGGIVSAMLRPVEGAEQIARVLADLAPRTSDLRIRERTVNGQPGPLAEQRGVVLVVLAFEVVAARITRIWAIRNPEKLRPWSIDSDASKAALGCARTRIPPVPDCVTLALQDIRTRNVGAVVTTVSVRYIVHDIDVAIAFYRDRLGFHEDMHPAPAFAMLSRGDLRLVLSTPGGGPGGGQAMPDGTVPEPGGWNRFSIEVSDLEATVASLRAAGVRFRNEVVTGVGGKQILLDDPSGNPVELFEPTIPEARLHLHRPDPRRPA